MSKSTSTHVTNVDHDVVNDFEEKGMKSPWPADEHVHDGLGDIDAQLVSNSFHPG